MVHLCVFLVYIIQRDVSKILDTIKASITRCFRVCSCALPMPETCYKSYISVCLDMASFICFTTESGATTFICPSRDIIHPKK